MLRDGHSVGVRDGREAIERGARALVVQHGREALAVALRRRSRWEVAGRPDAAETWRRIAVAIKTMEKAQ